MSPLQPHSILGNQFVVSAQKVLFWQNEHTLILSDLHLGKSGHFRKHGIGIPQSVFLEDLQRLMTAIQFFNPQEIIIVGDLFHSTENKEHELFARWRNAIASIPIHLVMGNHDVLNKEWYQQVGINMHDATLNKKQFVFLHDKAEMHTVPERYYFTGHIHPGVRMSGKGKQSLQLPCFYFDKHFAVLPAFGKFTGTHLLPIKKGVKIFAITDKHVLPVN